METRRGNRELAIWSVLALIGGGIAGWVDLSGNDVQGPVLVVMLAAFAVTLPGRAPVWLVAIAAAAGLVLVDVAAAVAGGHGFNAGLLIAFAPALIGAGGGKFAGRLLGNAAAQVAVGETPGIQGVDGLLTTRTLLAVALVGSALAGVPLLRTALSAAGHPLAAWLALLWQVMTLLGWIADTPILLRTRQASTPGLRARVLAGHLFLLVSLAAIHAVAIVAMTAILFIPLGPGWAALTRAAFSVYLPLDALAYLAILSLAHASDAARHRREAAQQAVLLRAESVNSRLAALRSRLNPHFLFNALNSVSVLAASGKGHETGELVQGLTTLLRYVLDERRTQVPAREELDFVRQYFAVQQARFGDRLRCAVVCDAAADSALVPQLLLQPLVENAVEHGVAGALDGATVSVRVTAAARRLRVVVEDDGPGPEGSAPSLGIGLSSTRERLSALYGQDATLSLNRSAAGITRVEVEIPLNTESAHA